MHLIVGLGNPGPKYQKTRHNIGFLVIERLAERNGEAGAFKQEHKSLTCKIRLGQKQALLAMPQTYMNLSGQAVRALVDYYDIEQSKLLVAHDDVDLAFGAIRYQTARGHAGHNGIRDIHSQLGTKNYDRLKLGVDRPSNPHQEVADYVLQNFSKDEQNKLNEWVDLAAESIECYIENGLNLAATKYNRGSED